MEELSGLASFSPQSRYCEKSCLKGIGWEMIGQDSQHPIDTHTLDKIKIKFLNMTKKRGEKVWGKEKTNHHHQI